jgi:hypothetical protein
VSVASKLEEKDRMKQLVCVEFDVLHMNEHRTTMKQRVERDRTHRLTSGEMLMNSQDHNFKFGFRTSSRNVINKPHGCGRLATSRSSKTLLNNKNNVNIDRCRTRTRSTMIVLPTEQSVLVMLRNWPRQINTRACN